MANTCRRTIGDGKDVIEQAHHRTGARTNESLYHTEKTETRFPMVLPPASPFLRMARGSKVPPVGTLLGFTIPGRYETYNPLSQWGGKTRQTVDDSRMPYPG